ncbi:MAG: fibronectin type III domain-containing protein [Acidimicrobiaceae bacterium]|nr:fibronectin type III domain-containing protein [Acidimicrobiaceae bacterium]
MIRKAKATRSAPDGNAAESFGLDRRSVGVVRLLIVACTTLALALLLAAVARAVVPTVTNLSADQRTTSGAQLNATINPQGSSTTYHFEYGPTSAYGQSTPESASIGSDSSDHQVADTIAGLDPHTVYHFRVVATNADGSAPSPDATFATLGPLVSTVQADQVGTTDARLNASVNPNGSSTTFHFDYGTDTSYGQSTAESSPIGSDSTDHQVSRPISGLSPDTTYHFRLVATNADGTFESADGTFTTFAPPPSFGPCPNDEFRGGPSGRLPDCRAYEQVSPVDKNGDDVTGGQGAIEGSPAGDAITFIALGGVPGGQGAQDFPLYFALRGPGDWTTQGVFPPASFGRNARIQGWAPDLSEFFSVSADSQAQGFSLLSRSAVDGSITTIAPPMPNARAVAFDGSADGSRVFFSSRTRFTPDAISGNSNLYLWDRATNSLTLASVLPASAGGGPVLATVASYPRDRNVVSDDGDRLTFASVSNPEIYQRQGLNTPTPQTVDVSASQAASPDPNGHKPAVFVTATPDGSKVFFTSCEKLTDDSTAVSTAANTCNYTSSSSTPGPQGSDLYLFDTADGKLTDLSVDHNPADPRGADVKGVLGTSADGSYVYFVANGDLDGAGPGTPGNCQGTGGGLFVTGFGSCDLYLLHDGVVSFIARLTNENGGQDILNWVSGPGTVGALDNTARVSADGGTLLFQTATQLSPAANGAAQLYRYRADDQVSTCITCAPTGAGTGGGSLRSLQTPGPTGLANPGGSLLTRNLSSDGSRVFFESEAKLVAADTNGDSSCPALDSDSTGGRACRDVYEWEADGSGSCHSTAQNGGCLYLLSAGTGSSPSYIADVSSSGNDVFIFTRDQLVPQDRDGLVDVYDLRVDGGISSQHAMPPSPCSGDACQGSPTPPPGEPGSGSSAFAGPGNQGRDRSGHAPTRTAKKHKRCKRHKHKCNKRRRGRHARATLGGVK